MTERKPNRIYAFDFLRIIAVCAVAMIHISGDFISGFDNSTAAFIWGNVFSCVSRFAVPVFLMISGALMLDEEKSLPTKKILKAAMSILALLFSWSFLYAIGYDILRPIIFHKPLSIWNILDTFFNGHYHMWYLYVVVGLYLITPLLRFFVKTENAGLIRNYLLFSVIICFGVSFVNVLINSFFGAEDVVAGFVENFNFKYIYEYLIYYILGWYIVKVGFQKPTRIIIYIAGIAGLVTTFLGTQFHFGNGQGNYFISNNSLNVFLYGLAVFTFVHHWFSKRSITLGGFGVCASRLTFGVYLIHCCFLFVLKMVFEKIGIAPLEIIATFVVCIVVSFTSVWIMSKIPLVKKLIRE